MMIRKSKANGWLLFALLPFMLLLLVGDALLPETPVGHGIVEIGIVLLTFGLMALWVHANAYAIQQEEYEGYRWTVTAITVEDARAVDALPLADCLDNRAASLATADDGGAELDARSHLRN
jgi:hypothetical protein